MPRPLLELMPAAQLREMFRLAADIVNAGRERGIFGKCSPEERSREHIALATLPFCVIAAGGLRDPSFLPMLADAVALFEGYDDDRFRLPDALQDAIGHLVPLAEDGDQDVAGLARHENASVRCAVVWALDPSRPRALALLEKLADDSSAFVREQARKRLADSGREVPWWRGKFLSDPTPLVPAGTEAKVLPKLLRIAAILDLSSHERAKLHEELFGLILKLPDPLVEALAACIFRDVPRYGEPELLTPVMGARLLRCPGGPALLETLVERWSGYLYDHRLLELLDPMVRALAMQHRQPLCKRWLARTCALAERWRPEEEEKDAPSAVGNQIEVYSRLVARHWGKSASVAPLLDMLLRLASVEHANLFLLLNDLGAELRKQGARLRVVMLRLIEARLAGYPGPWKRLDSTVNAVLLGLPPHKLRPLVEQAIRDGDDATVAWGMMTLLERLHDPGRDPPRPALLAGWFQEPRLRHAIVNSSKYELPFRGCLPLLRRELRAGNLTFHQALLVIELIDLLYGGGMPVHSVWGGRRRGLTTDSEMVAWREELRGKAMRQLGEELLGPAATRGPVTGEEWRALRLLRRAWIAEGCRLPEDPSFAEDAATFWPEGPWREDDLADLLALSERWLGSTKALHPLMAMLSACASRPFSGAAALVDRIEKLHTRGFADDTLDEGIEEVRIVLGLIPEAAPSGEQGPGATDEEEPGDGW